MWICISCTGPLRQIPMTKRSTCRTGTSSKLGQRCRSYRHLVVSRVRTRQAESCEKRQLTSVADIGVSNFAIKNLEKLLNDPSCKTVPAVNQIELHPNCPSPKLLDYCKEKGIHATAYSCLGSTNSPLAKDETLQKIADAHSKTTAQIL